MTERATGKDGSKAGKLSDSAMVEIVLREMKNAVPEIERRVAEREAMAIEARFEVPRASDITTRRDDS